MLLIAIAISAAAAIFGLSKLRRELRVGAVSFAGGYEVVRAARPIFYWTVIGWWGVAYLLWLVAVIVLLPRAIGALA